MKAIVIVIAAIVAACVSDKDLTPEQKERIKARNECLINHTKCACDPQHDCKEISPEEMRRIIR